MESRRLLSRVYFHVAWQQFHVNVEKKPERKRGLNLNGSFHLQHEVLSARQESRKELTKWPANSAARDTSAHVETATLRTSNTIHPTKCKDLGSCEEVTTESTTHWSPGLPLFQRFLIRAHTGTAREALPTWSCPATVEAAPTPHLCSHPLYCSFYVLASLVAATFLFLFFILICLCINSSLSSFVILQISSLCIMKQSISLTLSSMAASNAATNKSFSCFCVPCQFKSSPLLHTSLALPSRIVHLCHSSFFLFLNL